MRKKKAWKESGNSVFLRIQKEMAQPRQAKSVREQGENLAAARIRRGNSRKSKA